MGTTTNIRRMAQMMSSAIDLECADHGDRNAVETLVEELNMRGMLTPYLKVRVLPDITTLIILHANHNKRWHEVIEVMDGQGWALVVTGDVVTR